MNANARKVHRTLVVFGVACAAAAALPCVAATVTVSSKGKGAPAEENIGFFSGLAIGAVAGGPIGAVAGGISGALIGEHIHKQKMANHELAADLSGSNADKAKLTRTVMELDGGLDHARDLTLNIPFRTGDANLTPEDIDQLTVLAQLAESMSGVKVRVSGYTDPRGSKDYNDSLSKDRAESVAAVLTNTGLSQDRVVVEALGADGADANGNLDDYAFQRRVSIKLIGAAQGPEVAKPATDTVAQIE